MNDWKRAGLRLEDAPPLNRPVCVPCKMVMRCAKNEFDVQIIGGAYYSGDRWECNECGASVVVGFGSATNPSPHHESIEVQDV